MCGVDGALRYLVAVPRLHFVVVLDRCTMRDAITEMARRYGEVL